MPEYGGADDVPGLPIVVKIIGYVPEPISKRALFRCSDSETFVQAIKAFKEAYEKVMPRFTLWNNTRFTHIISLGEEKWTNAFLNRFCIQTGATEKVGFIVSPDVLAMYSVMDVFEEEVTDHPGYFSHEQPAEDWFFNKKTALLPYLPQNNLQCSLQHTAENGTTDFNITVSQEDMPYDLKKSGSCLMNSVS
ncbi:hypothetical protein [Niabella drilacis]|uniref:Uncharacterized protein n=1 Tax=Niabella drilacis (strain DSM 25811 / CCM 8410 / CCUG 62505 / LMG 26954 / E90) TaxID=1285928 RepID=A0A1G7BXF7_NIADE|nr:hypothetical protein [Niabella drilacis]SDE31096.1 hypothetical protein SAMN04487894_13411 [Niabella drilacis]